MITENYVSFETAKLLKEKGFKNSNGMLLGKSGRHYNKYETFPSKDMAIEASIDCEDKCPLVTLQMAMKWLREERHLHISIEMGFDVDNPQHFFYMPSICKFSNKTGEYNIPFGEEEFNTYEEACEAAIKYCLENLI